MHRTAIHEDITLASRFECKYLISPVLVPALRKIIRPFTRPDPFAALVEGYRYPICSLYLDSDDLRLYQQTVGGEKNRFKLRVRSYSDDPASHVFFEVKSKVNNIVRKRAAPTTNSVVGAVPIDTTGYRATRFGQVAAGWLLAAKQIAQPAEHVANAAHVALEKAVKLAGEWLRKLLLDEIQHYLDCLLCLGLADAHFFRHNLDQFIHLFLSSSSRFRLDSIDLP